MTSEKVTQYRKGWNLNLSLLGLEVVSDRGELMEKESLDSISESVLSENGSATRLSVRLRDGRTLEFPYFPAGSSQNMRERLHELQEIKAGLADFIPKLLQWHRKLTSCLKEEFRISGYITDTYTENALKDLFLESRPEFPLAEKPEVRDYFAEVADAKARKAFEYWQGTPERLAEEYNDAATAGILRKYAPFFQIIEKSPLTEEQARAVVNLNTNLLLVASAGSGKTSVMVAKAAYALLFGYFKPSRVVLIAFNRKAVAELRQRIRERFSIAGIPWERVQIETFHALSYKITRKLGNPGIVLSKMFRDGSDGTKEFMDMLRDLIRRKEAFRIPALFFCSLSPSMNTNSKAGATWRSAAGILEHFLDWLNICYDEKDGIRDENTIAEYLIFNDDDCDAVSFIFRVVAKITPDEPEDTAQPRRKKKKKNRKKPGEVIKFTANDIESGSFIVPLVKLLRKKGFSFRSSINERLKKPQQSYELDGFIRTMRSFLTHAKNSLMTPEMLWEKYLSEKSPEWHNLRTGLFLKLFRQVYRAWIRLLDGGIDFEDMLNLSVQVLERHPEFNPYDLVMVDEAQDISLSRARLLKLLVRNPETRLFAVGDDWQSINRFSGAVINVMSDFAGFFGQSDMLKLETTFRCSQEICDVSSSFISRNKSQIAKNVRGIFQTKTPAVVTVNADCDPEIPEVIAILLRKIIKEAAGKKISVMLLGRYNDDRKYVKKILNHPEFRNIVQFMTVHKSKGLEADYVIIVRATSGILGFPCNMTDDRLLDLVMPESDSFPYSEERRLFYVGITRARIRSYVITLWDEESEFTEEINSNARQNYLHFDIPPEKSGGIDRCPLCHHGITFLRQSKYGYFYACCRFKCGYTKKYYGNDDDE